jgi:hypothetical protein
VVVGQDQAISRVDDKTGALRGLIQVLEVGADVDDARLDLAVDDAGVAVIR